MRKAHIGIIVGVILFHVVLAALIMMLCLRRRRQRKHDNRSFKLSSRGASNQERYRQQYLHYARVGSWQTEGHAGTHTDHTDGGASGGASGGVGGTSWFTSAWSGWITETRGSSYLTQSLLLSVYLNNRVVLRWGHSLQWPNPTYLTKFQQLQLGVIVILQLGTALN